MPLFCLIKNSFCNTKRCLKLICMISKTTSITGKILPEILQDIDELKTTVLQNRATIDSLLNHNCWLPTISWYVLL